MIENTLSNHTKVAVLPFELKLTHHQIPPNFNKKKNYLGPNLDCGRSRARNV